jgi:uncharacterized small protein (DUF1192 family)
MMRRASSILCGVVLACAGSVASAQDSPPAEQVLPSTEPDGPAKLRETLVRRRDMAEAMRSRLDEAIARIDRGEEVDPDGFEDLRGASGADRMAGRGRGPQGVEPPAKGDERMRPMDRGASRSDGLEGPIAAPGSNEEQRRMRAFVDQHLPLLAERLRAIERDDAEAPRRMLGRLGPRLREAMDAQGRSPELFELRIAELQQGFLIIESARRFRRVVEAEGAESVAAQDARERFRALAIEHYDTQLKVQRMEVAELEARIADLRAEIDRKVTNRDHEIDARIEDLLRAGRMEGDGPGARERRREGQPDVESRPRRPDPQ